PSAVEKDIQEYRALLDHTEVLLSRSEFSAKELSQAKDFYDRQVAVWEKVSPQDSAEKKRLTLTRYTELFEPKREAE
ncbi:hypothetical protein ABTE52_23230, partial [Acinetobacter baumannii]